MVIFFIYLNKMCYNTLQKMGICMEKRYKTNNENKELFLKEVNDSIRSTDIILDILNEKLSNLTGKTIKLKNVNVAYKECILDLSNYLEKEDILFFNNEFPFSESYKDSFMKLFALYDRCKNSLVRKYNKVIDSVTTEEKDNDKMYQTINLDKVRFFDKKDIIVRTYILNMIAKMVGRHTFDIYLSSEDFRRSGIDRYSQGYTPEDDKYNHNRKVLEADKDLMEKTAYGSLFSEWFNDFYSMATDTDRRVEEREIEKQKRISKNDK